MTSWIFTTINIPSTSWTELDPKSSSGRRRSATPLAPKCLGTAESKEWETDLTIPTTTSPCQVSKTRSQGSSSRIQIRRRTIFEINRQETQTAPMSDQRTHSIPTERQAKSKRSPKQEHHSRRKTHEPKAPSNLVVRDYSSAVTITVLAVIRG